MACLCNAIDQLSHYKFDKRLELLRRLNSSIDNFQCFDRRKRSPHELSTKFWDFFSGMKEKPWFHRFEYRTQAQCLEVNLQLIALRFNWLNEWINESKVDLSLSTTFMFIHEPYNLNLGSGKVNEVRFVFTK